MKSYNHKCIKICSSMKVKSEWPPLHLTLILILMVVVRRSLRLNLLLSGKAPPLLAPWLCGAPIMALQKKDSNSYRPIAVGETLRRYLINHFQDVNNMCILKVDFRNAFNECQRQKFLTRIATQFPELFGWVQYCYYQPAELRFGSHRILSSTGVQQGDPLRSPPFFSCFE